MPFSHIRRPLAVRMHFAMFILLWRVRWGWDITGLALRHTKTQQFVHISIGKLWTYLFVVRTRSKPEEQNERACCIALVR